jgi:hypothetical protein
MPTELLYTDGVKLITNLTGDETLLTDSPDAPDSDWIVAVDPTLATDLRMSFTTPTNTPDGAQSFRCFVRKTAGAPNPTLRMDLYQNSVFVKNLLLAQAITSDTGEIVTGNFNATDLIAPLDGSNVEIRLTAVAGTTSTPGAQPAFGAFSAVVGASVLPVVALLVTKPTVVAGNLMILEIAHANTAGDSVAAVNTAGWTAFPANPYGVAVARKSLWWRIATGTETGQTVSVGVTGTELANNTGVLVRIANFTASNGFGALPFEALAETTGIVSPILLPTVVCTNVNRLAVAFCRCGSSNGALLSATGEAGGDWIVSGPDGNKSNNLKVHQTLQTASMAAGGTISGGSFVFATNGTTLWDAQGFALVPTDTVTPVNTIEIGAIEWDAGYTVPPGPKDGLGVNFVGQPLYPFV